MPSLSERLRSGLDFEGLYEAFGGKLAHWQDFVTDYGELYPVRAGQDQILTKNTCMQSIPAESWTVSSNLKSARLVADGYPSQTEFALLTGSCVA